MYKYFTCIYHVTINQQRTMNKQMFILQMFIKIFILKCKNWVKDGWIYSCMLKYLLITSFQILIYSIIITGFNNLLGEKRYSCLWNQTFEHPILPK